MGQLVVLDGLDGSGKTTQLARLGGYLTGRGIHYRQISFPDYRNPSSSLVRMYLDGAFGSSPDAVGLLGLPRPDLVIFLDMPPEVSQTLLSGRYEGDEAKKDIHERDRAYLLRCRDSALYAAGAMGWQVISCADQGRPLPVEEVTVRLARLLDACTIPNGKEESADDAHRSQSGFPIPDRRRRRLGGAAAPHRGQDGM